MMLGFLEKLQKRPEREKRAIALGVAGGITLLIAILWLMSVSLLPAPSERAQKSPGPFSVFVEQIGAVASDATGALGEVKAMFRGAPETFVAE